MNNPLWSTPGVAGIRHFGREVGAWSLSPDDQWLAFGDALPGTSGQSLLHCVEIATGRAVVSVPGGEVKALGWASPELLLVVRAQGTANSRLVAHAIPDGGVTGSVALENLSGFRARMSLAQGGAVALVTPPRWRAQSRQHARKVLGYVVRTDPLEVARVLDPDELGVVHRIYEVRETLAELAPDGTRIALWYGPPSAHGPSPGTLVLHDWQAQKSAKVCEAGASVVELLWTDARTIALRSVMETDSMREVMRRGDLTVVDLELNRDPIIHDTTGEDPKGWGWMGGRATMDLHPDRQRLLVAGRVVKERGRRAASTEGDEDPTTAPLDWTGALRVIDLESGLATGRAEVTSRVEIAMGAAWLDADGTLGVFTGHGRRDGRITVWRSVKDGPVNVSCPFLMEGKSARAGALTRSAGGRWLVAHWRTDPVGTTRREVGSAHAHRLALVETEQILRASGL